MGFGWSLIGVSERRCGPNSICEEDQIRRTTEARSSRENGGAGTSSPGRVDVRLGAHAVGAAARRVGVSFPGAAACAGVFKFDGEVSCKSTHGPQSAFR
jgi:hypothetical protein